MSLSLFGYGVLAPSATQFNKIHVRIRYSNGFHSTSLRHHLRNGLLRSRHIRTRSGCSDVATGFRFFLVAVLAAARALFQAAPWLILLFYWQLKLRLRNRMIDNKNNGKKGDDRRPTRIQFIRFFFLWYEQFLLSNLSRRELVARDLVTYILWKNILKWDL